jgi:hypothetical protein
MDPRAHDGKTGRAARRGEKREEDDVDDVRPCYGAVREGGGGKRRGGGYEVGEYDSFRPLSQSIVPPLSKAWMPECSRTSSNSRGNNSIHST